MYQRPHPADDAKPDVQVRGHVTTTNTMSNHAIWLAIVKIEKTIEAMNARLTKLEKSAEEDA